MFCLVGAAGDNFHLVEGDYLLGRDPDNDLVVREAGVSRRHAKISIFESGLVVEDLASTNGTFVNGRRIKRPARIHLGDSVAFGQSDPWVLESVDTGGPDQLLVVDPSVGYWYLEPGEYLLGRGDDVDLQLADDSVSGQHARLVFDGRTTTVEDLNSTNGTWAGETRLQYAHIDLPQAITLGSRRIFLARPSSQVHAMNDVAPVVKSAQEVPQRPHSWRGGGLAVAALLVAGLMIAAAVGHHQGWLDRFSDQWVSWTSGTSPSEVRQAEAWRRAEQVIARAASDRAFRQRLRTLAEQTAQLERSLAPMLSEVDRVTKGLRAVISNPAIGRMLGGTELGTSINQVDRVLQNGGRLLSDLRRMPTDLNALESALSRYQSRPGPETLIALVEPANRAAIQTDRVRSTVLTLEGVLGLGIEQLDWLSDTSRAWSLSPEISGRASEAAGSARGARQVLMAYRSDLESDLDYMRRIFNEARVAQTAQR